MSNEYTFTYSSGVPQTTSFASSVGSVLSSASGGLIGSSGDGGLSRLVDVSGGSSSYETYVVQQPQVVQTTVFQSSEPVVRVSAGNVSAAASFEIVSEIENAILRSSNPITINETETITVNGESGIWSNRNEVLNWRGVIPITQYVINEDSNPEIIRKRTEQELVYEQEVAIRYLRPPTPPPPGEIIIRQEKNISTPPAPPLVIRQQPPRPETPAPLVIREAPPQPPAAVGQKVITISGKRLPPPPRKVIIERLAPLPSKPQSLLIERWLPYSAQKRKVIFQRNTEADPVIPRPRNVIIQWEAPRVQIRKEFKDLGVIRANPVEYVQKYGASLKASNELPEIVREIRAPSGVVLAAEYVAPSVYELEGDVQALSLIDLEREGLSEYRSYVRGGSSVTVTSYSGSSGNNASLGGLLGSSSVTVQSSSSSLDSVIAEIFASVDRNSDGRLSLGEAQKLLLRLNSRLGRRYGEEEALTFVRALDANRNGTIEFDEFRRAIVRQFA